MPPSSQRDGLVSIIPGLVLTMAIAGASMALQNSASLKFISPMILAIVIGMAIRNVVGAHGLMSAGIDFTKKRILRLAIILLGIQVTLTQLLSIGAVGMVIVAIATVATFFVTIAAGRVLRVDSKLAELIAAGTAICGASAVIATNTVTRAPEADAVYAVACVTLFGTISTLLYPVLFSIFAMDPSAYGLWVGATVHEVAQVVAAAYQSGPIAGETGTISKLARVLLLAPMVMGLGYFARSFVDRRGSTEAAVPVPWFVFGFFGMVVLNSVFIVPHSWKSAVGTFNIVLLSAALGAIGLDTQIRQIASRGLKPLLLCAVGTCFIAVLGFLLVTLLT